PGAMHLRDDILNTTKGQSIGVLRIGLESTSVYSFHPSMFLDNDESLQALGAKVYVMNPKEMANFKKSYNDIDKTDEIDVFVIADYYRFGRMPMTVVKDEQYVALKQLTRASHQLVRQIKQEKQRFLQYLSYKCNTFTEEVDSSVFGKAMMDLFFEQYSLDELAHMSLNDLTDYLRAK